MTTIDLSTLPVVTRVLLTNDGSTTRCLQAITGTEVRLVVNGDRVLEPEEFATERIHLGSHKVVRLRRSQLLSGNRVLSTNIVLYPPDAAVWSSDSPLPLGLQLRGAHTPQHREILAAGVDEQYHQAFKEYVVATAISSSLIYIRELFSPLVAPINNIPADSSNV
ncbi:hypothetical protein [Actinomyces lilanjuaniae]|uniref:hypothetical protein n=1 Tax=Actinomyces lilanjuaniae TaxID=2321394 RepID=UPI0013C491D9|nr:hypothetical protein [Actinomyces lilanjuaniae]